MGGAIVNFRTGQSRITDFDKKYLSGKNEYMRDRVLTSDGKKQVSQAGMKGGRTDAFPSQDYLKQSNASRMGDRDLRKQFVNDSIRTQGRKEEHRNIGENYGRVAKLYGMQTSEVGAKVKEAIKKKKTPLNQTKPTAKKKSVEINPKDGLRRPTPPKSRIGLEPTKPKGLPPGTKIDGDMSKSGRKYPSKDEVGTGRDSIRRQSIKDKLSSTKRTPVKMKKC
jgi:hypothetical protein